MKIRYFAWVRERVGHAEEEIDVPPDVLALDGELGTSGEQAFLVDIEQCSEAVPDAEA